MGKVCIFISLQLFIWNSFYYAKYLVDYSQVVVLSMCTKMHIVLHVMFIMLSIIDQNWNVLTQFSRTPLCKMSWESIICFQIDTWGQANLETWWG